MDRPGGSIKGGWAAWGGVEAGVCGDGSPHSCPEPPSSALLVTQTGPGQEPGREPGRPRSCRELRRNREPAGEEASGPAQPCLRGGAPEAQHPPPPHTVPERTRGCRERVEDGGPCGRWAHHAGHRRAGGAPCACERRSQNPRALSAEQPPKSSSGKNINTESVPCLPTTSSAPLRRGLSPSPGIRPRTPLTKATWRKHPAGRAEPGLEEQAASASPLRARPAWRGVRCAGPVGGERGVRRPQRPRRGEAEKGRPCCTLPAPQPRSPERLEQ